MNECIKHGIKFDNDECIYCQQEEYEARFRAEVYRSTEEKYRTYIMELRETIEAQDIEISRLKKEAA